MGTGIKILPSSGYRLRLDCDLCGSESLFVVKTLPYNMAVYPREGAANRAFENGHSQTSLRSLARGVQLKR